MKAFSILLIGLFYTVAWSEERPKWVIELYPEELPAGIQVEMADSAETSVATITNRTGHVISYRGFQPDKPRIYRHVKTEDGWSTPSCHWCATGLRTFSIHPRKSQRFVLPKASATRRIFTLFFIDGTQKGGLIETATQG